MKNYFPHLLFHFQLIPTIIFLFLSFASAQTFTTSEGNEIEVKLQPDKETIMLGETAFISFIIENHSKHELSTGVGGDYRNNLGRPESFKVTVVRDDGLAVPQPQITFSGGGFLGGARIPVNGSSVRKLFLPHWATFSEAGTYIITVSKSVGILSNTTTDPSVFQAKVSTKIRIVPTDKEKLGVLIDSLGKTMLDENNWNSGVMGDEKNFNAKDALMILNFIDDERTIKYFVQALDAYSKAPENDFDTRYTFEGVAYALSKYNDDSAFEALRRASESKNKEIRLSVAGALERSSYSKAVHLLFSMRNDDYYFVRLRVVWALGKIESEESTSQLKEMLKDENEEVRKQAQEFLDKRSPKIH